MKKRLSFIFIHSFLLLLSAYSCTVAGDRFNLMFTYSDSLNFVWLSNTTTPPKIDTTEVIDDKYPICFESGKLIDMLPDEFNMWYLKPTLSQWFVFPSEFNLKDTVEISINNKCIGMDTLKLKILGFDKFGDIITEATLDINNEEWLCKSSKLPLVKVNYFTVSILGSGLLNQMEGKNQDRPHPKLYLDKMTIKINGKDINQINEVNNPKNWTKEHLNPKFSHVIPSLISNNILEKAKLNNKKIIAIGETVHGSKEINRVAFEIAKDAIINNNCKLILSEQCLAATLKINLYLQGKLAENEISNIREEMHGSHISMPEFVEFLIWLRKYNQMQARKVVILGLMDIYELIEAPLYDYIFAFYDEKKKDIFLPLLTNLHKKELDKAYTFVTNNLKDFEEILGEDQFLIFYHTLSNLKSIEIGEKELTIDNYDYHMWLNANTFISMYPKEKETVLIYAHYGHVGKKEGLQRDLTIPTMGVYINNFYIDDYSVVGVTVGKGDITTREKSSLNFMTLSLEESDEGSLENLYMQSKDTCFYYPSNKLLNNIYLIRNIGNKEIPFSKNEVYSNIKANTDGFIFIRNSQSFNDDYSYTEDYFWNKAIKRAAFLKSNNKLKK